VTGVTTFFSCKVLMDTAQWSGIKGTCHLLIIAKIKPKGGDCGNYNCSHHDRYSAADLSHSSSRLACNERFAACAVRHWTFTAGPTRSRRTPAEPPAILVVRMTFACSAAGSVCVWTVMAGFAPCSSAATDIRNVWPQIWAYFFTKPVFTEYHKPYTSTTRRCQSAIITSPTERGT